jgi:hypothetical protein
MYLNNDMIQVIICVKILKSDTNLDSQQVYTITSNVNFCLCHACYISRQYHAFRQLKIILVIFIFNYIWSTIYYLSYKFINMITFS